MPPIDERLGLAELTMRALEGGAELPPKIGVHPRQPGSLAQAMPALLHGGAESGADDMFGVKWIAGFPENVRSGLPAYHALVVLNEPATGVPIGILDGGPITAERTAAVSGVAIRLFELPKADGRNSAEVAVLGAGVQARSHLAVVGRLMPGASVRLVDRDADRAAALAEEARSIDGVGNARTVESVRQAVEGASLVISAVSFGPDRQALDPGWLTPDVTFVAVDYDMQAPAALALGALFVTDDRPQFLATRSETVFAGYPDPDTTLGAALREADAPTEATRRREGGMRPPGRVLVAHLGVGLADVVFASAILERAETLGLGMLLAR